MKIEFILVFYLALFYFVALAPKGRFSVVFSIWGYFMSVMLTVAFPPLGIAGLIFVWACQRMRKRKDEGKPFFKWGFKGFRRNKKIKEDYATKAIRDFAVMLDNGEREDYQKTIQDLTNKNQVMSAQEEQIRKLLQENEYLKQKQAKADKITEVTPRLRHYREQAKKHVEQEEIELEKLKRKRLEEEIRRLKNLDN